MRSAHRRAGAARHKKLFTHLAADSLLRSHAQMGNLSDAAGSRREIRCSVARPNAMPFLTTGDFVQHYRVDGAAGKPALLFANSLGSDLRIWDDLAERLAGGFRSIRYDLR